MLRLRLYGPGLVPPMVDLVAGDDKVEIVLDEGREVVVEWQGTLGELADALRRDKDKRETK